MDSFLSFITDYYYVFIIFGVLLIFALIGYFIDLKHPDEVNNKKEQELSDADLLKKQISDRGDASISSLMNKSSNQGENAPLNNGVDGNTSGTIISSTSDVESLDIDPK